VNDQENDRRQREALTGAREVDVEEDRPRDSPGIYSIDKSRHALHAVRPPLCPIAPNGRNPPENLPKCIFPGPGKILRFEADVCADPGKFGQIFDQMYMSNPGNFPLWDEVCVTIWVKSGGQGSAEP